MQDATLHSRVTRQVVDPGDDVVSIERFILTHRPLPAEMPVEEAPFWSTSQAQFLREEIAKDGDWAELVDVLGSLLSE